MASILSQYPCYTNIAESAASERVLHWVLTGSHVFKADVENPKKHSTGSFTVPTFKEEERTDAPEEHQSSLSSSSASSSPSSPSSSSPFANGPLTGCDDDLLIPTVAEINHTFHAARHTWEKFLSLTNTTLPTFVSCGTCDPSMMLKDVPAIPPHKLSSAIQGVAFWRRRTGEDDGEETLTRGLEREIGVLASKPTVCRLSLADLSNRLPDAPRGLAILTLCWSYIVSTKLLELQNRKAKHTKRCLLPEHAAAYVPSPNQHVLNLSGASYRLVRWLCVVLAPGPGWRVSQPPAWTACASRDVRFVLLTDKPILLDLEEPLPSSSDAADLVIELCNLFGLDEEPLPPYTAAFLAALALPLYEEQGWEPQFILAPLERRTHSAVPGKSSTACRIRQYLDDLPYYMTLSADYFGEGSMLWSIFWQPDIPCNLVSPWLGGILDVLRPLIRASDVMTLAKVFLLRRPRVALWWYGVFLLGSLDILEEMVLWLETTEGRYGRGLAARYWPDITGAAWTGASNSFWEMERSSDSYPRVRDLVPRAEVLRCRLNHRLGDYNWKTGPCWRPFGHIRKADVELDIWPSLERGFTREYSHWSWQIGNSPAEIQLGFRRDTSRFVEIDDDLKVIEPLKDCHSPDVVVLKRPTIVAVGHMLSYCMRDVHGWMNEGNAALPGFEKHKWQNHWNILPSGWLASDDSV